MLLTNLTKSSSYVDKIICLEKEKKIDLQTLYDEISTFWNAINLSELKLKASNIGMIPEEKTLWRNFIDAIEMLSQFRADFQEIKEKTTVLDRFLEMYSEINTFRKFLESHRRKEATENIEEILKKTLSNEEEFEANYSRIVEEVRKNDSFLLFLFFHINFIIF